MGVTDGGEKKIARTISGIREKLHYTRNKRLKSVFFSKNLFQIIVFRDIYCAMAAGEKMKNKDEGRKKNREK